METNVVKIIDKQIKKIKKDANLLPQNKVYKIEALEELRLIVSRIELPVKPACETEITHCKFCTRETTSEDFGYGKDKVCQNCLTKAIDNELRYMQQ